NVFLRAGSGCFELGEEAGKVLSSELPLERASCVFPVVLEVEYAPSERIQIAAIVGCQDLSLDDGEIDFDLIEPTGMNRGMNEHESGVETLEARNSSGTTVGRAVIDNPEDTAGIIVGRPRHHLLAEPVKWRDAILLFTAAKDPGVVNVESGEVRPGAAAEVLVLD